MSDANEPTRATTPDDLIREAEEEAFEQEQKEIRSEWWDKQLETYHQEIAPKLQNLEMRDLLGLIVLLTAEANAAVQSLELAITRDDEDDIL